MMQKSFVAVAATILVNASTFLAEAYHLRGKTRSSLSGLLSSACGMFSRSPRQRASVQTCKIDPELLCERQAEVVAEDVLVEEDDSQVLKLKTLLSKHHTAKKMAYILNILQRKESRGQSNEKSGIEVKHLFATPGYRYWNADGPIFPLYPSELGGIKGVQPVGNDYDRSRDGGRKPLNVQAMRKDERINFFITGSTWSEDAVLEPRWDLDEPREFLYHETDLYWSAYLLRGKSGWRRVSITSEGKIVTEECPQDEMQNKWELGLKHLSGGGSEGMPHLKAVFAMKLDPKQVDLRSS